MNYIQKEETWDQRIARERKEERERINKSLTKIREVIKLMGYKETGPKNIEEYTWACVRAEKIVGPVTWALFFAGEGWHSKGRIEISGTFPKWDGQEVMHSYDLEKTSYQKITVSVEKSSEHIAKDIERRFMPGYSEALALANQRISLWQNSRNTNAIYFAEVTGRPPKTEDEIRKGEYHIKWKDDKTPYGDFRIDSDGEVTIELNKVSILTAQKILKLIQ